MTTTQHSLSTGFFLSHHAYLVRCKDFRLPPISDYPPVVFSELKVINVYLFSYTNNRLEIVSPKDLTNYTFFYSKGKSF